jgi:exopolyphosphatase / guanosine-5'-triphosphate,3'-diphosphate pyrophosphatase
MRAGCIDIGSNTTRLLVADRLGTGLQEVHQERAFTRIGRGLATGDEITAAKIEEVVAVVVAQVAIARDQGAEHVCGVATAAIRSAANGHELVAAIRAATGLEVEVLSGEKEARLAFRGAAAMLDRAPGGPLAVLDVGGGSSEMVIGTAPAEIGWWASVALGSSTLTDRWLRDDPPTPAQLAAARREVSGALAEVEPPRPALALAVGGSATSLSRMAGSLLDAAALVRSLRVLCSEPSAVVAFRSGLDPQRARLLPAGLLILEAMSQRLGAAIVVGRGGIREGVLLEALGQ